MKATELKNILSKIIESSGDTEIIITVKDYYSKGGYPADLCCEITPTIWEGIATNKDTGMTRLTANLKHIKEFDGVVKYPKITFRK